MTSSPGRSGHVLQKPLHGRVRSVEVCTEVRVRSQKLEFVRKQFDQLKSGQSLYRNHEVPGPAKEFLRRTKKATQKDPFSEMKSRESCVEQKARIMARECDEIQLFRQVIRSISNSLVVGDNVELTMQNSRSGEDSITGTGICHYPNRIAGSLNGKDGRASFRQRSLYSIESSLLTLVLFRHRPKK